MWPTAIVALRRFLRDRSNLFFVFVLPFLIIFLVGYTADSQADAPLAVVGSETSTGEAVLSFFPPERVETYRSAEAALDAVEADRAVALAVFSDIDGTPVHYRSKSGRGLETRAALDAAVARANRQIVVQRQAALADVDSVFVEAALENMSETPVVVDTLGTVVWGGLNNLEASALTQVVLFMFLSALTAASFLVQDRRLGMAMRKATTPVSISRLVAGEALGRFFISLFQAAVIVAVTRVVFGVRWGNPLATLAILGALGLVATGTGVLLGTAFDKPETANGAGITLALVLAALGGAMAPVEVFPDAMQTAARFTPHFWAIDGLQTSLTSGALRDVISPFLLLVSIGLVALIISTGLYRRKVFGR